jgi:serine protease inhibitor
LTKIGLKTIFNENTEAFDRVASKPLYASKFKQKAEIKVDENGTVAKAETFMTMCLSQCIVRKEEVVFDKPFSYFIRNAESGEILFLGKVNKLSDC